MKRILSILMCLVLLVNCLPAAVVYADNVNPDNRVADPSTMDTWRELFLPDPLTTNNAGAVWTDKSVFTDAAAFAGTGIVQNRKDSFMVALSAIASNMSITGVANVPTDTMMILDLSSSMYNGSNRNPDTVSTMLDSVNQSINKLQNLNIHNRVGVVIYYGGIDRNQSDASNSMVLLPLDRYSGTTSYLKATVSGGRLICVGVNSGVKNSAGISMSQTTRTVTDVAGTYAQLGILDAMDQLLKADTTVPATADFQPGAARVPVMIFMSDGEPTAATHNFTKKVAAGMGNNTVSIRSPNETDFVTQLTAAYAREMVDAHYVQTDPVFYTLSLGTSVSLAVMDPENHTTTTIDGYWKKLINDGKVGITVYNSPNGWSAPTVKKSYTVSAVTANGAAFPSGISQRNYVDKAFTATNANQLTDAFSSIVDQISLVSKYTPTLVSGNANLSGYISFVDKVGNYMEVTDIAGILIDHTLYSGEELARNFVSGGGSLGSYENPTALGDEMVWAVRERLDLESSDAARTLIGLAYEHGQLRYNGPTDYSNYIGWYANAAGAFLGFWHEDIQTMPAPTGDAATDPAFIIKSYAYLGAVDESKGVAASDMMYATVQVRQNIATGEQSVVFAVPAALIPLINYEVVLDLNGEMKDLSVSGANHPIRLVYEVALQEQINEFTLKNTVSADYLAAHTNADGSVNFYTNQYEQDNTTGYGKVNTYSYFNPSRQNDKYYYLEDTPVYTDTNGTLYTGGARPEGVFYRAYTVYTHGGAKTLYRRLSDAALATAKQSNDGSWYIGAGNVHVNLDGYTISKAENSTGTLSEANIPFVDAHNHSVGELGYNFIIGSTLGNNGRITLKPQTGITLSKAMMDGVAAPNTPFSFVISNVTNSDDAGEYPAVLVDQNGARTATTISFADGSAAVAVAAGQTLYIGGMTAGTVYRVEEIQTPDYIPVAGSFTVTTEEGHLAKVAFVNALRGSGNLLISKEVRHQLGSDYIIPEDLSFTVHVRLEGVGVAERTFEAVGAATSVTTDESGCFTVTLKHHQQIQILNLPEGTTAYVTEPNPGPGFTAAYQENGQPGDGVVIISDGEVGVDVINTYVSGQVDPVNIVLYGTKHLDTAAADWNGATFLFQLQKRTEQGWTTIATTSAGEDRPTFDFNEAMSQETFAAPGTYFYQVLETFGGQTLDGISYDATLHTFGVSVTDRDMDGQLEIDQVTSFHTGNAFSLNENGDWQIDIAFHNRYDATGCKLVLDVLKRMENPSGSPLVSPAGFRFGLYDGSDLIALSEYSDGVGEARILVHYELEDEGTHTYTLREIVPDEKIPGMHYDETAYQVTVAVRDNADGTMSAEILAINDKTDYDTPVFTNTYNPQDVTLPIDFVDKTLHGRDLQPGEFSFELKGQDDPQHLLGTNDADGNVVFDHALRFDAVGIYRFELRETTTDGNGISTDKSVYTMVVTVTDANGILTADYQIVNLVGKDVLFENTYTAKPVTHILDGTKQLTGRVLLNEEFTFVLTEAPDSTGTGNDGRSTAATNFMDGTFRFAPLTFTEPGIYYYRVHEERSGSANFGILYDETAFMVTVVIADDLKGNLYVADVTTTVIGGDQVERVAFTNRYVPAPTSAYIPGSKELIGKVLNEGDFSFDLYEADENWNEITLLERSKNDGSGSFVFSSIDYETAGDRFYLVREANGGQVIDGVHYDDTVYRVTIQVTDDLRGQLHAQVVIVDGNGIPHDAILFRNVYTTGEVTVTLSGTKTLVGKDLTAGAFTFELYEADEKFTAISQVVTAVNGADGTFSFPAISFTHPEKRHYLVKEANGGQVIDGVHYDDTIYHITVEVTDNQLGALEYALRITNGEGVPAEAVIFENSFTEPPPETGDTGLLLWVTFMALSCGAVLSLTAIRKKNETNNA